MNTSRNQRRTNKGIETWFNERVIRFESARFGWMTIYITLQSCLGAVACMFILQNNANNIMLASCAAITMASNAVFIAQMSGKWCLTIFYMSLLFNSLFIFLNV